MNEKQHHARLLALACGIAGMSALAVHTLPAFPEAFPPDPEVSIVAALPRMPRHLGQFEVLLDIPQGCSNEVLVAVGRDGDEDGDLADGEIDLVFGCDCGQRYWMRPKTGEHSSGIAESSSAPHWEGDGRFIVPKRHWDFDWNMVLAVRRGLDGRDMTVCWSRTVNGFTLRIR